MFKCRQSGSFTCARNRHARGMIQALHQGRPGRRVLVRESESEELGGGLEGNLRMLESVLVFDMFSVFIKKLPK